MTGRIPPVLLALGVTLLLVAVVVVFAVVTGGVSASKPARTCDAALAAGAYPCVTFVSSSGNGPADQQAWLKKGGLTFSLTRHGGADRIGFSGECADAEAPVSATTTRLTIGAPAARGTATCSAAQGRQDAWAAALLAGTVGAVEQSDATLVLTHGARRVVFSEVLVPKP